MEEREKVIRLWFDMWLKDRDLGILDIFTDDALYIESWGPEYKGALNIKRWFDEWNVNAQVKVWDIKQFIHSENQTVVEWYFACVDAGEEAELDGVSIIKWTGDNKIKYLKEFACKVDTYNPYEE